MEKHKIAFFMKSNFSFDRFRTTCISIDVLRRNLEVYHENLTTYEEVDDLLEFWKPELVIVDSKLVESDRIESLLENNDVSFIRFTSDFDYVIGEIKRIFSLEEIDQEDNGDSKEIKYIKQEKSTPEKVIIEEKIIEKEIIRKEYTSMRNKLVIVASLWAGAGSTTFAINLARAIAERGLEVSYVEYPMAKPYMFDYLSIINKEDEEREIFYKDFAKRIIQTGKRSSADSWEEKGIKWFVTDTRYEPFTEFTFEDMLKLVYSINSPVTIVDVSHYLNHKTVQDFLHQVDDIFICIEPDPVKIDWMATIHTNGKEASVQREEQRIIQFLNELEKKENIKYEFVVMKDSDVIERKEFLNCLEKEPLCYFPSFPYEDLLKAIWESTFLYDNEEYTDIIEKAIKPVIVRILPREFYDLKKNKSKSIFNIFKRRGN